MDVQTAVAGAIAFPPAHAPSAPRQPSSVPGSTTSPAGTEKGGETDATLAVGIAAFYNAPEQNVSVSFQPDRNSNEIVIVFTDKQTGKVIVQFPSETLIALAKFFDKLDGSVVNKKV
jgi:hypothetical protein